MKLPEFSQKGQVLYLPMNEGIGTKAYDHSFEGNDGDITGASWVAGKGLGSALSFDGTDDYVDCGSDSSLDAEGTTGEVSYEAWFKPDIAAGDYTSINVVVQHERSEIFIAEGAISQDGEISSNLGNTRLDSGVLVSEGEWFHVVVAYDGSTNRIYVNGELKASGARTLEDQTGKKVVLGATMVPTLYFDGTIDQVRVYNRALSEQEIKRHYAVGKFILPLANRFHMV